MARKMEQPIADTGTGIAYIVGTSEFLREDRMLRTTVVRQLLRPDVEEHPQNPAKGIFFSVVFGGLLWVAMITPPTLAWLFF